ncbi:MAG: hypothetical protein LR011_01965 [Verrucomicrobia bacterium]|nr:hypothetical protein [Verrucomicrobiota bacterium]
MANLTQEEENQLRDTIEMFEMITQTQPDDYQSLLILKEAYYKLHREADMLRISKMLAKAYRKTEQTSAALMEYEALYEKMPGDPEISEALAAIRKINQDAGDDAEDKGIGQFLKFRTANLTNNGKAGFEKIFLRTKKIGTKEFANYWHHANPYPPRESFLEFLDRNKVMTLEESLLYVSQKSNTPYIPLSHYNIDIDLLKRVDRKACARWQVFPFDCVSRSILVATTNPFGLAASSEIESKCELRVIWYLADPHELRSAIERYLN